MHSRFDRLDEAIRVVSEVIDSGRDRYEICRRERAALRLQRGDLADALDDIEIALADTSIIAPRFERSVLSSTQSGAIRVLKRNSERSPKIM
jgi:hypothetical protein